jgi:hypothetical protein
MSQTSSESDRLRSWAEDAPTTVDLTQPEEDAWTRRVADEMLERWPEAGELLRLEETSQDAPILVRRAPCRPRAHIDGRQPEGRLDRVWHGGCGTRP